MYSAPVGVVRKLKELDSDWTSSWFSVTAGCESWPSLRVTPRTYAQRGAHSGLEPPQTPACAHNHIKRQQHGGRSNSSSFHMDPSSPQPAFCATLLLLPLLMITAGEVFNEWSGPAVQADWGTVTAIRHVRGKKEQWSVNMWTRDVQGPYRLLLNPKEGCTLWENWHVSR